MWRLTALVILAIVESVAAASAYFMFFRIDFGGFSELFLLFQLDLIARE